MNSIDTRICKIIEDVLSGRLTSAEFWEQSKLIDGATPEAAAAWHMASHFVTDEDIRQREPEYEARLLARLRGHLGSLRGEEKNAAE